MHISENRKRNEINEDLEIREEGKNESVMT